MEIARAVFATLALLGFLGLATANTPTSTATATGLGGAVTNDGGTPAPPPDGRGGKR